MRERWIGKNEMLNLLESEFKNVAGCLLLFWSPDHYLLIFLPHSGQNLAVGETSAEHAGQRPLTANWQPHSGQNLAPLVSAPHWGQTSCRSRLTSFCWPRLTPSKAAFSPAPETSPWARAASTSTSASGAQFKHMPLSLFQQVSQIYW